MFNNIFESIFKKPKLVVLSDGDLGLAKEITAKIMGSSFNLRKEVLFTSSLGEKDLLGKKCLITRFGGEDAVKLREKNQLKVLTFGFKEGPDIWASDLKQNNGTTFKINYLGKSVPVWIKSSSQEEIHSVLVAIAIGLVFGLNMVQISQALGSPQEI